MNKYQEIPVILKQYANSCISYFEANKPTDLWRDIIDMLKQEQYGSFAIFVLTNFHHGTLVYYAKCMIQTLNRLERRE